MTDSEYLAKKGIETDQYSFSERVSIMVIDGGVDLDKARELAVAEINKGGIYGQ
ncbi:MAG: hypothetical protein M0Q44_01270 [Methylobacter sp.]|jgi:hypothetical protein|nr:hypothetical protein [Methylobacter sp.]